MPERSTPDNPTVTWVDDLDDARPSPWPELEPGTVIDGKYHVVGELGYGAMGVVLHAIDESLERSVALKIIRPERLRPGFAERFAREAKVMARLNHPNVVVIHAFGQHESLPYFVMELVTGQTLREWLAREPLHARTDQALDILNEVCLGVSAIHAAGTVHRDVKPSNILLDSKLHARVADFGVSTTFQDEGASAPFAGTPAYMAPEIAFSDGQRGVVTPSADVYSVACVAYQTLTGRLPVNGDTDIALLAQHAIAEVAKPTSIRPDLPPSFDRVLLDGLAKNPKERTESVEAFRAALAQARERMFEPTCVLLAEDDADFRDALEIKLRMEFPDAEVLCVGDGSAALRAAADRDVSLAILDLQMPQLGAVPVTAALRSRAETADIPIVILTAAGGPSEWRLLRQIGADRFLVKPVDLDDVVAQIRRMMREHGIRDQHSTSSGATLGALE